MRDRRASPLGSLRGRFLTAFALATVPIMLLAWWFQLSLIHDRALGRQAEIITPVLHSTQETRDALTGALLLIDILATIAEGDAHCEKLGSLSTTTHHARIYDAQGRPLCAGEPLPAETLARLGDQRTVVTARDGRLWVMRDDGTRIVAAELHQPMPTLAAGTQSIALEDGTGAHVSLAGPGFDPGDAGPLSHHDPQTVFFALEAGSAMRLRISQSDVALLAHLKENYALPPAWQRIATAAVLPLGFLAFTLIIGSFLIDRFALRDIHRLRREIALFRQKRTQPQPKITNATSRETLQMREDFAQLATLLVTEESIAQARLDHAEDLQREVFHRVSNNFQIVQSITRLIERGDAKAGLDALRARIHMLSAAHHALHQLDEPDLRSVSDALPELVRAMSLSSQIGAVHVDLVGARHVLPVRETYALLHLTGEALLRFEGSGATDIRITLQPDTLTIEADAPPTPPDAIGPRLIETFARELDSNAKWESDTRLVVRFPGACV